MGAFFSENMYDSNYSSIREVKYKHWAGKAKQKQNSWKPECEM